MPDVFIKDPEAVLSYQVDWEDWLTDISDTISSSAFTAPTGITKDSESNTTLTGTVTLSGGTNGNDYTIKHKIVTAGGLTDVRRFKIRCLTR